MSFGSAFDLPDPDRDNPGEQTENNSTEDNEFGLAKASISGDSGPDRVEAEVRGLNRLERGVEEEKNDRFRRRVLDVLADRHDLEGTPRVSNDYGVALKDNERTHQNSVAKRYSYATYAEGRVLTVHEGTDLKEFEYQILMPGRFEAEIAGSITREEVEKEVPRQAPDAEDERVLREMSEVYADLELTPEELSALSTEDLLKKINLSLPPVDPLHRRSIICFELGEPSMFPDKSPEADGPNLYTEIIKRFDDYVESCRAVEDLDPLRRAYALSCKFGREELGLLQIGKRLQLFNEQTKASKLGPVMLQRGFAQNFGTNSGRPEKHVMADKIEIAIRLFQEIEGIEVFPI